ncbi:GNAT family N-acetyltransferase [Paracoccaceae bacterium Fryx2]|nr:GNAT family N-acetyltransferase [Paracoccaceae bacterium Fryx2]
MTDTLVVRPVTAADVTVWRAMWQDYLAFYHTTLPEAVYRATFARVVAGGDGMHGRIAERGGQALGLVHFLYHPTCWKTGPVCYLQDIYTVPSARGQGVARALMQAVFTAADAAGAPDVYWLTAENNYPGRMLYDQLGVKTAFIEYNRAT